MKRFLLFILLMNCVCISFSQDFLFPIKVGDKWGYIDQNGIMVIAPRYLEASVFSEGFAVVTEGKRNIYEEGGYFFIDNSGNIAFERYFGWAAPFSEGLARVQKGSSWLYIDREGKTVIRLRDYYVASDFHNGYAVVQDLKRKYNYIDKTGKLLLDIEILQCFDFSEGLGAVVTLAGKTGFVDKTGRFVIEPIYRNRFTQFQDGVCLVQEEGSLLGYISTEGSYVLPPRYYQGWFFSEGLVAVDLEADISRESVGGPRFDYIGLWGVINKKGDIILKNTYKAIGMFKSGRAPVLLKDKWGYIDTTGKLVIPLQFTRALDFDGPLAMVYNGNEQGYVTLDGKIYWGKDYLGR